MHGENLLVDDRGNRKAVEAVGERLPQFDVVPAFAYIIFKTSASGFPDGTRKVIFGFGGGQERAVGHRWRAGRARVFESLAGKVRADGADEERDDGSRPHCAQRRAR